MDYRTDDKDDGLITVATGAGWVFGGRIVKLALLFGVQLVMARVLGSTAYGGVVLATMVGGIGGLIAKMGLPAGLTRQLPYHEDDPRRGRGVVRAGAQLAIISSILVGTAVFVGAPLLAERIFEDPSITILLRIGAIGIPFSVLKVVGISVARGARDAKTHVIVRQVVDPLSRAVFIGGLVLAGYGAIGAITGSVLANAAGMVIAAILAWKALPFRVRGPTTRMHRNLFTFSFPLLLAASMSYLVAQADTILIGVFLTSQDVGVYNIAFQLREVGMLFFYPITFLLPPVLTRLSKHGEWEEARQVYVTATKWMVLLTTPIFVAVLSFPEIIIGVTFGAQYLPASTALRILAVPIMVTVLLSANGAALVALGHNRINLYVNAGTAILNILFNIALIPLFGIVGAALASAISFIARDTAYTLLLHQWEGLQPFSVPMVRPFLVTIILSGLGYSVFVSIFPVTLSTVVAIGLAFLVMYVPGVVLLGAIEPEDEVLLRHLEDRLGVEFIKLRKLIRHLQS